MKIAQALLERSNTQKDLARLQGRIEDNLVVQEGDEPAEDAYELMDQYDKDSGRLLSLMQQITAANAVTRLPDGTSIADAIVKKDMLAKRLSAYRKFGIKLRVNPDRYSRREIRYVRCADPLIIQKKIENLNEEYRRLDVALQEINWTSDMPAK